MTKMAFNRNRHARQLFDGIASKYDLLAEVFSFLQNGVWRNYLVSRLNAGPDDTVMDLCTGTAAVAMEITRTHECRVVGVDLSTEMLRRAQVQVAKAGHENRIELLAGRAENLGFANACFDEVSVTYLFRYVDDPEATLREIVRVLKPGGRLLSLEFGVPENKFVRGLWYLYTRGVLPFAARLVSPGWRRVGAFLGPSISRYYSSYPVERIQQMWVKSGLLDVQVKRLSLGGGVVMWGTKGRGEVIPG